MPPSKRSLPWQRSGYEQQLPAYRRSASWSRGRNKQAGRQARPAARPPASTPASGPRAPSPDYFGSDDDDDLEWLDPPAPQATPPSSSGATQVANRPIAQPTPRLTPQSSQPLSGRTPQSSSRPGAFTVPPSVIQTPPATQQRSQPYNRGGMPSSSQGTPTSSYRPSQIVRPNTQSVTPAINIPAPQINRMSWQSSQSSQPSSQSNPIVIDSDEDISSTPYQPENDFIPIGYVSSKIVGVQYYRGIATMDENLLLVREPRNQYDRNAIRVDNVGYVQVGHIPREVAAVLAPYLDRGDLQAEATVTAMRNAYAIPIALQLFASPDRAGLMLQRLMTRLEITGSPTISEFRNPARPPPQKKQNVGPSTQATVLAPPPGQEYAHLLQNSIAFDAKKARETSEKFGKSMQDLENLPMATQPDKVMTKMLPYQLQGLAWLVGMEHPKLPEDKEVCQFWTKTASIYLNVATHYAVNVNTPPKLARGGILADDMGLGKTLQIISLLVADPKDSKVTPVPVPEEASGTLIVAPVSLLSNWTSQIEAHLFPSTLSVTVVHNSKKQDQSIDLSTYDVVVTSYSTLISAYKKDGFEQNPGKKVEKTTRGIFGRLWRRVVLDEGHTVRNPSAKVSLAVTHLDAVSRWSLTGTPIINNLMDLYAQLRFLHFSGGFSEQQIFNTLIVRPTKAGDPKAARRLQVLMAEVCLRRRKDMKLQGKDIIELPGKDEYVHKIEFTPQEQTKYELFRKEAEGLVQRFANGDGKGLYSYSFVLEILLRMRQFSDHWSMCRDRLEGLLELSGKATVELTAENIGLLQQLMDMSISAQEDCPVCFEPYTNETARITICKHIFCQACIEQVIGTSKSCPLCRAELPSVEKTLIAPAKPDEKKEESESLEDMSESSSKLDALLQILDATRNKDRTVKTVVFSQFTKFLDIIQVHLEKRGYTFVRVDGSMPVPRRDVALENFSKSPKHTIMLASLAVCSVGLNLVSASQVILADSWWAPSIEDQAVDRVHRLGQTKRVTIWRLIMQDSIEEKVIEIQDRKRKMIAAAFNEKNVERSKQARLADLQMLLSGPRGPAPVPADPNAPMEIVDLVG